MTETKRLVADIIEDELSGEIATAIQINEAQVACANFTDQYRDPNKPGRPVMWDIVDYSGIPRDFFGLCMQIAECEIKL